MINFFARLKEPEKAYNSINILLKNLTRENLLTISVAGIAGASLTSSYSMAMRQQPQVLQRC